MSPSTFTSTIYKAGRTILHRQDVLLHEARHPEVDDRVHGRQDEGDGRQRGSTLQPESQKSTTQQVGDSMSGNSNENQDSMMNKMKNAVGMGDN
ncbi:hypothetical protein A0H81_09060 [Grifola frondosa]|uniref:Uncharacterized protein n=1 Tax=Grifola frondosa TaxID=5627 RepID=A0A1C7M377_GRIFR|nr:hypothetical protein A0H81_09060 [Grifola frondosa]